MTDTSQHKSCTLLAGLRVERGNAGDWRRLAPLHYRSHHAGAIVAVFKMIWRGPQNECGMRSAECGVNNGQAQRLEGTEARRESSNGSGPLTFIPHSALRIPHSDVLVGVIVYSRSPLSLAARNLATGGRYRLGGGRAAIGTLINRELRIISRVVIAPNWRGLGLGARLVRETLPLAGTPYVEALAAMGHMSAFFERAGMTAYPQPPAPQGERLRAAFESVGIGRLARRSAASLAAALEAAEPSARALVDREMARWTRSYLAAKNHKPNEVPRERLYELVAGHLDSAPVYYLWQNGALAGGTP